MRGETLLCERTHVVDKMLRAPLFFVDSRERVRYMLLTLSLSRDHNRLSTYHVVRGRPFGNRNNIQACMDEKYDRPRTSATTHFYRRCT